MVTTSIKFDYLINMIMMQLVWLAAVMGAASGLNWPALLLLLIFAGWQLQPARRHGNDLLVLPLAVICGLFLDSIWINLGWIKYANPGPFPGLAPLWILILWAALALTLNHSLKWLQNRWILAPALIAIACPLSYLTGQNFGALDIANQSGTWLIGLSVSWAIVLPSLLWFAGHSTTAELWEKKHNV